MYSNLAKGRKTRTSSTTKHVHESRDSLDMTNARVSLGDFAHWCETCESTVRIRTSQCSEARHFLFHFCLWQKSFKAKLKKKMPFHCHCVVYNCSILILSSSGKTPNWQDVFLIEQFMNNTVATSRYLLQRKIYCTGGCQSMIDQSRAMPILIKPVAWLIHVFNGWWRTCFPALS